MNNVTRIVVVASAFSALAAIACTTAPGDDVSVEVQQGTVDPNCIKGGLGCAPTGGTTTSSGGKGGVGGIASSSGLVLDPGTSSSGGTSGTSGTSGSTMPNLVPPKGIDPINCGDACRWKPAGQNNIEGCDCGGAGNGLQSGIVCPIAYPCRYYVWGAYRCYQVDSWTGTCR
ncbi:MAG: hypothetical protein JST00_18225 [Deltaproteobacteria bacterium]|nr:hypothetical protein [Deltaproteobacteria bacterium]